ncbi:hypothetical protein FR483_n036L [Paramecium bursaria Chlorella virus FR483]|uniref:Uncharacterized protein n036L n=1 Tax=Paramecium bursaria Chlorella virus FR483 TaxID=399781 RepID=A7J690_PBCVF|nr:hypothetical protein FR483_n036L [Paramecium bursaria Chlorella virus FR483]ABT15321.1 hypothetical protein FR483_n036L [Paramecium bursaria Chlorella virus FR483]
MWCSKAPFAGITSKSSRISKLVGIVSLFESNRQTSPGEILPVAPSSTYMILLVGAAIGSEATQIELSSFLPMTRGLLFLAITRTLGSLLQITPSAYDPRSCFTTI